MSSNFVNPTYYNLQKATIRSEFQPGAQEIDVTALIPSLTINSSITNETMSGTARFLDSTGLLEKRPLRAEEMIIFELADSKIINGAGGMSENAGPVDDPFVFVGFIYKIDNVTMKNTNDAISYDVHFISYQSFKAGTHRIIRAFKDVAVSEIAQTIFDDYYANHDYLTDDQKKEFILENTEGSIRCVIPKMRPEEAMTFLSKRAFSTQSPSCTFRFFESSRGYHFVTDEELFRLSESNPERKFTFTSLDAIPDRLEFFDAQLNNLEMLENTRRVNSIDDLYNGAYRNKIIELDIMSRRTNLLDGSGQYEYFGENQARYFSTENSANIIDRHTRPFIDQSHRSEPREGRDEDVQKTFVIVKTYSDDEATDNDRVLPAQTHYAEIASNRQAYAKHIESITVSAVGPGRFDISAGDVVDLDVKENVFSNGQRTGAQIRNKHLSGNYIVKSVSHVMEYDTMKNIYVLIKKDWSEVAESNNDDPDLIGRR
jgi:hypothetical protein